MKFSGICILNFHFLPGNFILYLERCYCPLTQPCKPCPGAILIVVLDNLSSRIDHMPCREKLQHNYYLVQNLRFMPMGNMLIYVSHVKRSFLTMFPVGGNVGNITAHTTDVQLLHLQGNKPSTGF